MSKKKLLFIVNNFAGISSKGNFEKLVSKHIDKAQFDVEIKNTMYPNHGNEIALQARQNGLHIVVAVGGDGTINEAASALIGSDVTFGVVPAGSGNGFGSYLGITRDMEKALQHINNSKVIKIDTCSCNDQQFINVAGVGFDAKVVYASKRDKLRGFLNYFLTTVKLSPSYAPIQATVTVDDTTITGQYAAIVLANGTTYGYGFKISPRASFTDGLFDVILIKHQPVYRYFLNTFSYFSDKIYDLDYIELVRGKSVTIKTTEDAYYHLDGEGFKGAQDYSFGILPLSLNLMVPVGFETGKVRN